MNLRHQLLRVQSLHETPRAVNILCTMNDIGPSASTCYSSVWSRMFVSTRYHCGWPEYGELIGVVSHVPFFESNERSSIVECLRDN